MTTGDARWATNKTIVWFVMIKDTKNRFPNNPLWGDGWGWALFKADAPDKQVATSLQKGLPRLSCSSSVNRLVIRSGLPSPQIEVIETVSEELVWRIRHKENCNAEISLLGNHRRSWAAHRRRVHAVRETGSLPRLNSRRRLNSRLQCSIPDGKLKLPTGYPQMGICGRSLDSRGPQSWKVQLRRARRLYQVEFPRISSRIYRAEKRRCISEDRRLSRRNGHRKRTHPGS